MVSNVARLTRSLRDTFLDEVSTPSAAAPTVSTPTAGGSSPASFAPRAEFNNSTLADKINTVRRELLQSGEAIFTDERGNRFRIERKPA